MEGSEGEPESCLPYAINSYCEREERGIRFLSLAIPSVGMAYICRHSVFRWHIVSCEPKSLQRTSPRHVTGNLFPANAGMAWEILARSGYT